MSLFRFIKLILQHYLLVLFVPFFMAALVYYLTIGEEKSYSSSSSIYTGIASGFNVDMGQGVGDRFMVQSVFENVLTIMRAKEVKEEVGVKLIAQHLIQDPKTVPARICTPITIQELHNLIPEEVRQELAVAGNFDATFEKTMTYLKKDHLNVIYRIVHTKRFIPNYSILALNHIGFRRIKTSDLVKVNFTSTDPGVAMNTLRFFSEAFIKKYRYVKVSETNDIVAYFEARLLNAQAKLDGLEADLLAYRSSNNILDYTEQVRAIAQRRQEMEGEIYRERMTLASAEYTSKYAQEQLDMHLNVLSKNTEIIAKRNQLEALASEIARMKIFDEAVAKDSLDQLELKLTALRTEMERELEAIFAINYSTSGVKTKDILKKWFDNILNVGESKARLKVFATRQKAFKDLYQTMAPIGSNLTKIEREVAVAEGSYLRILEALNLAKMRQQNIALSTKLKVVDAPLFPTSPDPSNRKLLVIVAFLVGGLFIVGLLVLLEWIDQSIRRPLNWIAWTGLPLASAFPLFPKKQGKIYYNQLKKALIHRLIEELEQQQQEQGSSSKTIYLAICSLQDGEGKTLVIQELAQVLVALGKKISIHQPRRLEEGEWKSPFVQETEKEAPPVNYYELDDGRINSETLFNKTTQDLDYILIELPYLQGYQTPHKIWSKIDNCVLVARANRSWGSADKKSLENLKRIMGKDPMLFLNAVKLVFLEEIIGRIPRKRSKWRQVLRQWCRLEFQK
ncbi:GumC family protein [Aureispira anguillae]|uniref:Uncharacterized protein n=1 Tax=Aureispira anguillae TaxID=2864201 RepID=A0A915YLQ2_9BACT|nr:hypothetical protein [Aureispira anguillae]BDS15545.1 hypothetical protein AsAng_0063290 [Aureispira anguillae]